MSLTTIRTKVFPGPQNLPLFIASRFGFFEKYGVQADIQITVGSDEQRGGLASGDLQVIHSAVDNAVHMVEVDGLDAVIVSGGSTGMNDLVVRPEVRAIEGIRGHAVVVDAADTAYAFQLYTILAMRGIRPGEFKIVPAGGATQRLQAMREDRDRVAAMLNPPWNIVAEAEGFRRLGTALDFIGPYQGDGIFVRASWARANSDALVGYIRAVIEGTRWAFRPENRSEAIGILASRLGIDKNVAARSVESAIDRKGLAPDASFDLPGFRNLLSIRQRIAGTWKEVPEPDRYCDFRYHEEALAGLP